MTHMHNPDASDKSQSNGKVQAFIILVVPLLIMVVATVMYRTGVFNPVGRTNQGVLISPVLQLSELPMQTFEDAQGQTLDDILTGKWHMILVDNGQCNARCDEWIYLTRQIHVALGKYLERVDRTFVTTGSFPKRLDEFPGYRRIQSDSQLADFFAAVGGQQALDGNYLFLADPLGNIMMFYTEEHGGKQIMKDFKKMLKVSTIG